MPAQPDKECRLGPALENLAVVIAADSEAFPWPAPLHDGPWLEAVQVKLCILSGFITLDALDAEAQGGTHE